MPGAQEEKGRARGNMLRIDPQGEDGKMAEIKICPFLRDECRREECMLYDKSEVSHVSDIGYCAFYSLLREIRNLNDRPGKFV
jgi:hypothetical protein